MKQISMPSKRALIILPKNKFEDEEYHTLTGCLKRRSIITEDMTCGGEIAKGINGTIVNPGCVMEDVDITNYEALALIGGVGSIELWHNNGIIKLLTEAYDMGKLVCAICLAPVTLANADLLTGKKATAFDSAASYLRSKGATYTGRLVEIAGNIITARGPEASQSFAIAIADCLAK